MKGKIIETGGTNEDRGSARLYRISVGGLIITNPDPGLTAQDPDTYYPVKAEPKATEPDKKDLAEVEVPNPLVKAAKEFIRAQRKLNAMRNRIQRLIRLTMESDPSYEEKTRAYAERAVEILEANGMQGVKPEDIYQDDPAMGKSTIPENIRFKVRWGDDEVIDVAIGRSYSLGIWHEGRLVLDIPDADSPDGWS